MNFSSITKACLALAIFLAALGMSRTRIAPTQRATKVTLTRRTDNGVYGKSAYSLRYATQDPKQHKNHVDLYLNQCGNLHITGPETKNRIAISSAKKLTKVKELPEEGWLESCFTPEKSRVYVMQVEDANQRMNVKLRILDVKPDKLVFEWLPLVLPPPSETGTNGQCGGSHDCS